MSTAAKSKIFILPTREGLAFLVVGVVLFVISLAYTHNLAFSAASIFMSVIMISAFFTNNNLSMLEVKNVQAFGGESGKAELKVAIFNKSRHQRFCLECSLAGFSSLPITLEPREWGTVAIRLKGTRGRYQYGRITLFTRFPFGLFRAWRNYRLSGAVLIYPEFKGKLPLPVFRGGGQRGDRPFSVGRESGSEEFFGHRKHNEADSLYRVDWKAYARERGLWNKVFEDPSSPGFSFDYEDIPLKDREEKLSQMAKWIEQAEAMGASYKIHLDGAEIAGKWGRGKKYFSDCMEALSLWESEEKTLK